MNPDNRMTRLEARLERAELRHDYKCARREAKAERKEVRREVKAERNELRHEYRCARRQARHGLHHSHPHHAHFHGHCGSGYGPGFGGQGFGPAGFGRGYGPGQPRRPGEGHTFIVGAVSRMIGWGKQAVQQATQSHNNGPQQQQGQAGYYPRGEEQQEYQYAGPRDIENGVASGSVPAQRHRGGGGDEKRHHNDEDGEWEDVGYDSEETAGRVPEEPLPPYEPVAQRS